MGDADDAIEPETQQKGSRSRKKSRVSYLPQELVSSFLLRLPAQPLYDVMGHVCREWNLLISAQDFIYSHLRNSNGGLLFEDVSPPHSVVYAEMRGGRIEISSSGLECGRVINSCNGLILATRIIGPEDIDDIPFVINPVTKQRTTLPPCHRRGEKWCNFAVAFAEASMEYKVVCSHEVDRSGQRDREISVLTIGVDRVWRDICVSHLTPAVRGILRVQPLVAGGYVHWARSRDYLLTLNVETEKLRQLLLPQSLRKCTHFLPMGSKLSAVEHSRMLWWYVWEMNQETGEWTMLHCVDMKPLRCIFNDWFGKDWLGSWPLGWLVAAEVLVFEAGNYCRGRSCIAYDVKTKGIQTFDLAIDRSDWDPPPHVNSLVWCSTTQKCKACEKTVYLVDQLSADNKVYHKACFRCHLCKETLKLSNYCSYDGVLYCRPHLGSLDKSFETAPRTVDPANGKVSKCIAWRLYDDKPVKLPVRSIADVITLSYLRRKAKHEQAKHL